jgi:hypothetical protein
VSWTERQRGLHGRPRGDLEEEILTYRAALVGARVTELAVLQGCCSGGISDEPEASRAHATGERMNLVFAAGSSLATSPPRPSARIGSIGIEQAMGVAVEASVPEMGL